MHPTPWGENPDADPHDRWFHGAAGSAAALRDSSPDAALTRVPGHPDLSQRVNRAGSVWDFKVGAAATLALFGLWGLAPLVWVVASRPPGVPLPGTDYLLPAIGIALAVSVAQGLLVVAGIGRFRRAGWTQGDFTAAFTPQQIRAKAGMRTRTVDVARIRRVDLVHGVFVVHLSGLFAAPLCLPQELVPPHIGRAWLTNYPGRRR